MEDTEFKQDLSENRFVDVANCRYPKQQAEYLEIYRGDYDPFEDRKRLETRGNTIVDETEYWITMDNQYYTDRKTSLVVVLKRFVTTVDNLTPEEFLDALNVIKKMNTKFQISGGAFFMRYGDTRLSGASVKHLHFHIVEPKKNTNIALYTGCKIDEP